MVKLQVDMSKDENKKLNVYKSLYGIKRKEDAIKKILRELNLEEHLRRAFKKED